MLSESLIPMFLSLLLGGLIGVQREIRQQKKKKIDIAGFRTYSLICLLGFLTGFLSFNLFNNFYFLMIILIALLTIIILSYFMIYENKKYSDVRIMSQILVIFSFFIGLLISKDYLYMSIFLSLIITIILFLGNELHNFAKKLTKVEIFATLKFAIISVIILPVLPNKNYSLIDLPFIKNIFLNQNLISHNLLAQLNVFNFYHIWLMVVFISGIAYIGYICIRIFGTKKGILLTGFLGGFMSSTALTTSFSIESHKNKNLIFPLAIGVIIACSVMFLRVLFEVIVLNIDLFYFLLLPLTIMGITGITLSIILLYKFSPNKSHISQDKLKSPFTLKPALTFALIFLIVSFLSKLFSIICGDNGIYLLSFISGITDVDAITISLCNLAKNNTISNITASSGIFIASITNTLFKTGIAYYFGNKQFFQTIMYVFSIILIIGSIIFILYSKF